MIKMYCCNPNSFFFFFLGGGGVGGIFVHNEPNFTQYSSHTLVGIIYICTHTHTLKLCKLGRYVTYYATEEIYIFYICRPTFLFTGNLHFQ